jgi:uridine phosphorylase
MALACGLAYCHMAVPYPNFPEKHVGEPLVTPQRLLDYARAGGRLVDITAPRGVLLVYRHSLMTQLIQRHAAEPLLRFESITVWGLPGTGGVVGLSGDFGIGGPIVGIIVEELVALGAKQFFSFGLAGGLQAEGRIGDIVLCTRAIRDEGVSHHYLPPDAEATPSADFTEAIARALTRRNASFRRGATWTIDTPFRETIDEVRHYRAAGVLTVEMEAAALFAVASVLGVAAASAFVLSDLLGETEWTPEFAAAHLNDQLQVLADAGIEAITETSG